MSQKHTAAIQKQFTLTVDAFSKSAIKDTPEVMAEKAAFAGPLPGDFALDVACGPGTLALALAPRVQFAIGIDVTHAMLKRAREFQDQQAITRVAFTAGEAERLPFADATFSLVTCQAAFHHMLKPESVLKEMARAVKPGGRVVIIDSIGPESEEKWRLYNQIEKIRDPSHTASLRLTSFLKMFDDLHLEPVRQSIKRRERPFDLWMRRAGLAASDARYVETRALLERDMRGDSAGHAPRAQGDDLVIVHHEAMFLLKRAEA
ncbi:MAG: class I SAM-dependent methyltransferase [Terriglobia bacterium]